MRRVVYLRSLALGWVAVFVATTATAQPVERAEHEKVVRELEELRRDLDALRERAAGESMPSEEKDGGPMRGRGVGRQTGGIFDKPFLRRTSPQVYVGGYFDVEYRNPRNQKHDFRFHRFIPFFYADLHERVKFASEVEFEDGSEVEIEFAFVDLLIAEAANFRAGVILDPLGKFNLIHDSPINDLTDRPLLNQFVIPTTLREVGAGLFGTLTPQDSVWEVTYEAYLTSGFKGLADDGTATFSSTSGLRNGRASKDVLGTKHFGDNNNAFAGVGRLVVSPALGSEVGVSAYQGTYDEASHNDLTIAAIDALYTVPQFELADIPVGPVEFQGEAAHAFVERDSLARTSGVPSDIWGYYAQMNYHFMPQVLTEQLGAIFLPGSVLTFVTRFGAVDLDGSRRRRLTLGLNFRPIESTAFKLDYQFNRATGAAPRTAEDDAFLASITSYF